MIKASSMIFAVVKCTSKHQAKMIQNSWFHWYTTLMEHRLSSQRPWISDQCSVLLWNSQPNWGIAFQISWFLAFPALQKNRSKSFPREICEWVRAASAWWKLEESWQTFLCKESFYMAILLILLQKPHPCVYVSIMARVAAPFAYIQENEFSKVKGVFEFTHTRTSYHLSGHKPKHSSMHR